VEQSVKPEAHVLPDAEATAAAGAARVTELAEEAVRDRGKFSIALSGGSTPKRLYELLARSEGVPWSSTYVFFGDERCVPPTDPASNYAMVKRSLLDHVPIPSVNVYRVLGELPRLSTVANRYDRDLRTFFGAGPGGPPQGRTFDLVLLGVGEDAHTASLFPGSPALGERSRWATISLAPEAVRPRERVSITLPVINAASRAMFLVTGRSKALIVQAMLSGDPPPHWPCAMVKPAGGVEWWVDEAAGGAP
jgi:6-phosphogluconolactonase